jgi:hypothetical protein
MRPTVAVGETAREVETMATRKYHRCTFQERDYLDDVAKERFGAAAKVRFGVGLRKSKVYVLEVAGVEVDRFGLPASLDLQTKETVRQRVLEARDSLEDEIEEAMVVMREGQDTLRKVDTYLAATRQTTEGKVSP